MWIDLVRSVLPDAQFASGASAAELTAAEAALGISLPADLVGLLSETDGATDGPRWTILFWPLHRIVDEHLDLDGEATTMAEDLATFLTGWLSGRLTVR